MLKVNAKDTFYFRDVMCYLLHPKGETSLDLHSFFVSEFPHKFRMTLHLLHAEGAKNCYNHNLLCFTPSMKIFGWSTEGLLEATNSNFIRILYFAKLIGAYVSIC